MPIDPNLEPPVIGRHNGYDIYPMPAFIRLEAVDMAATVRWYCDALGFTVMFEMPVMAHLRRRKYQDLLVFPGGRMSADPGLALCLAADGELDDAWRRASALAPVGQARALGPPQLKPWNARELDLVDPDGRRLVLFEQANDPEAARRMQDMLTAGKGG